MKTIMVTGGAGFIGSAVVRQLAERDGYRVVNVDSLTYAGNLDSLGSLVESDTYAFRRINITDAPAVRQVFDEFKPEFVLHLAAESHVDRSIDSPSQFIETNIVGTFVVLNAALEAGVEKFVHVSTDEVFGSLGERGKFNINTPYDPSSPYSASKAAADHLARAWSRTFKLPVVVTNCSNNYGPYQFPEKLIPLTILKGLASEPMPVYGKGENVRDWLFVEDHARALIAAIEEGVVGETYLIGGNSERRNIDVVKAICDILDDVRPAPYRYTDLITYVTDRPGHDHRYAIDSTKIERDLGWTPSESFDTGLRKTVQWYVENEWWWRRVLSGEYKGERLGLRAI